MDIQTIDQKVKEIKQSFRQMMDGATAQSMREKGLNYHLNWGATIPRLREMADELRSEKWGVSSEGGEVRGHIELQNIPPTPHPSPPTPNPSPTLPSLAIALWKENVRECKILATMLMPAEEMLPEVVDIWMEQTPTLEIAEQAAFNLYQHLPYAAEKAYQWLSSPQTLPQICGYHVLSRLFMRGQEPNERGISEFIDQALTALQNPDISLRKAAMNAMVRFSELGIMHQRLTASALKTIGMEIA